MLKVARETVMWHQVSKGTAVPCGGDAYSQLGENPSPFAFIAG